MPKTTPKLQSIAAQDKYEAYAAVAARKLNLTNLDLNERAFLGTCQDLYRNDRGCGTPFENFARTIIRWTTWGNPPTPELVIDEVKENFEPDWDLTLHSVKRFMQHYPELIRSLQKGAEDPQATAEPPEVAEVRKGTTRHPRPRR
jgi:hypothetical protein